MTITLIDTARSGKLLKRFTAATVLALTKMDVRKHQNAVMSVFHAAEYGECSSLNTFFNALKINDQTALKKWVAVNFSYVEGEETFNWMNFTTKKDGNNNTIGFHVIKGREDKRKGVYDFDKLMSLEPFYAINVAEPKVYDLNALLDMIVKVVETVSKKSEKENVAIPAGVASALEEAKRMAILHHIDEAAEAVANENEADVKPHAEVIADKYIGAPNKVAIKAA